MPRWARRETAKRHTSESHTARALSARYPQVAAVGAAPSAAEPTTEMGSFIDVLLRKELVRDAFAEPAPGDDTPEGAARQKLAAVHFGNPFKLSLIHI